MKHTLNEFLQDHPSRRLYIKSQYPAAKFPHYEEFIEHSIDEVFSILVSNITHDAKAPNLNAVFTARNEALESAKHFKPRTFLFGVTRYQAQGTTQVMQIFYDKKLWWAMPYTTVYAVELRECNELGDCYKVTLTKRSI